MLLTQRLSYLERDLPGLEDEQYDLIRDLATAAAFDSRVQATIYLDKRALEFIESGTTTGDTMARIFHDESRAIAKLPL